jgi:transposase
MHTKTTSQASREQVTDTINQPQPAAQKAAVIKLGIDVHAAKFKVSRQVGDLPLQPVQSFTPPEFLHFAEKQLKLAEKVWSAYEAGPTGFWLHRHLVKLGVQNLVIVPGALDAYGRKVTDDRHDARAIGLKLSRYVAGEKEALALVQVPSLEAEQRRALTRQRSQFGKIVRSLAAMGRSICLLHGYRLGGRWWRQRPWQQWQEELPAWLIEHLDRFRPTMVEAEKQILSLTKTIRAAAPKELPVGMGALTYEQIDREVVDWNRFKNRKEPASYAGLCGGVSSSGEQHADLPITKHGNARLRAILIELAWRLVMYQPQCRAVARWEKVLLNPRAHARRRKQAIVALARQLMIDLWRWRTGRITTEKLGWKMITPPSTATA